MYCTQCGAPNDDTSSFCTGCGAALKNVQPGEPVLIPPQPPVNPPKGPGKVIVVALVLLVCVIAVIALAMRPGCADESMPDPNPTSSTTIEPGPQPESEPANSAALERVNGWWQSVGQSGSLFHHFVDGTDYVYQRSFDDHSKYSHEATRSYTVEPFKAGQLDFTDDSGVAVHVDDGATYILEDSEEGLLTCRNMDGSGYSGSSSLARPTAGDIPDGLLDVVAQIEGSGYVSEPATSPANPTSLDVSGGGKGEVATLTGIVTRQNMTPADTGMIWGAVLYYLEFPEPVTITYNGPTGDPETQVFNRILAWSDEANPVANAEDEYYAEHPEEISTEYDQYLGSTIAVRGHIIDAGTAHYFGSGRFIDAEVVG